MANAMTKGRIARPLALALAALLGGWGTPALGLDPRIDPSRPSTRQPELPDRRSLTPDEELAVPDRLPSKPMSLPVGPGSIVLQKVRFEGNQAIPTETLDQVTKPFLNRPLSGSDLEELRYRVTLLYVKRGYVNSGAVIPEQTVQDGQLNVRITEGRLTDVRITDITDQTSEYRLWHLRDSYIRDRLTDDADTALNTNDLQQRYLMLLNDRMIQRLNGSLVPGAHPGEAFLDLKVTRARPYGGYLGVDNFSPPQIGSFTGRVGFWMDNMTTLGERIDFNMSPTGGSFSYNTGLDLPLNSRGTRFAFRYTNAETVLVEAPFDGLDIVNNIFSYDGQLSHPLVWDLTKKFTLGANFAVRQNRETLDGHPIGQEGAEDGQTQVTVFRTWQDFLYQGRQVDVALRSTFSVGLDALGATVPQNDLLPSGEFFAWLGQAVGRYRFLNGSYVSLNMAVQSTGDRLLALEKIAIGGFSTVRGYRQNYLVRDRGFFISLEGGYPIFGGEPGSKYGIFLVPFTDFGGGSNQTESSNYLQSVGIGLEGNMRFSDSTLSAGFFWAGRLTSGYRGNEGSFPEGAPYTGQDNGINFQVNWQTL